MFLASSVLLSTPLFLGLPSGLLPQDFLIKFVYAFHISLIQATHQTHLNIFYLISNGAR